MNSTEYYNWLKKFEKRTTSDDTFTPPKVYDVVREYVHNHIINLDNLNVVRPFYPSGDYTNLSQYDKNSIVIDNPPFSQITKICAFYQQQGVKFFLFAPALTSFSPSAKTMGLTHIIAPADIVYDNGAKVKTSFITNLAPKFKVKACPILHQALLAKQTQKPTLPKYQYSNHVLTVSKLNRLCVAGVEFEISADECVYISKLDSQKTHKKNFIWWWFFNIR